MSTGRRVVSAGSLIVESELPAHEAGRLLQKASGLDRTSIARDDKIEDVHASRFELLAERRKSGEPLQYLEGTAQFGPIELAVDPRVLIPRPETEQLWELVVSELADRHPAVVVDLGTGSGNLALAIKHSFPSAEVHAVDVSYAALSAAASNVATARVEISLHRGDLFEALPAGLAGTVDLVISNPPYISWNERTSVATEVRDHEPAVALYGGHDGLSVLRRVIAAAPTWLAPGGLLACEIGAEQGEAVAELAAALHPRIVKDLSQRDRFLIARKDGQ